MPQDSPKIFTVAPMNVRFQFGVASPIPRYDDTIVQNMEKQETAPATKETMVTRPQGLRLPHGA